MNQEEKVKIKTGMKHDRIFIGVFLILGAIFMLASGMGFVMPGLSVWSIIWSVVFVALLVSSIIKLKFTGIFFSIAFLGIIYAEQLNITEITPWPILGAALLLSIGCGLIFPHKNHARVIEIHKDVDGDSFVGGAEESYDGSCRGSVCFGNSVKYVKSTEFESADFECSFGDLKVYFDNAAMKGDTAGVHIENAFGSTELYFPKEWKVIVNMDNAFAGIKEEGIVAYDGVHTVYVTGDNSFGGVKILHV